MITGITFGAFDLLHSGHCLMFKTAKENCDYLIVGLQSDPTIDRPNSKNKPIQSMYERYIQLESLRYVDKIIPYQTEKEVEDILKTLQINIRFIGEDYVGKDFTGKDLCKTVIYTSRKHDYSTTELRQRILSAKN